MIAWLSRCFIVQLLVLSGSAEKLIIDTDAGGDDAMAILMLLRAEALHESPYEVVGITCTYGNTKEENVEKNVIRTLSFLNRTDIPVYGGAKRPLLLGKFVSESVYGKDGFGDSMWLDKVTGKTKGKTIESMHASLGMIDLTKKHAGNISIVVLGPPTNIALAASLDGKFINRVSKLYVMGSSVAGLGNYKANVEYNFGADPESNFILLSSTNSSQLTLLPWETAFNAKLSKNWRINIFGKAKSPYVEFISAIEAACIKIIDEYTNADSLMAATMLWPRIIKKTIETRVTAVTDGAARGSVLVDYPRSLNFKNVSSNAKIIQVIDVKLYKEALMHYLACKQVAC